MHATKVLMCRSDQNGDVKLRITVKVPRLEDSTTAELKSDENAGSMNLI